MNIKNILFLVYFLIIILLSSNSSFACENIIACFEEGDFNISEWNGNIQFQFVMILILTILFYKLLMEYFSDIFQMRGTYSFSTTGIVIGAILFIMSIYQNLDGILKLLMLIALVPIGILSIQIGRKIKGEEEIVSSKGYFAIFAGGYIFVRISSVVFGADQLEEMISLLGFTFNSIFTILLSSDILVLLGAIYYMNKVSEDDNDYDRSSNDDSKDNSLFGLFSSNKKRKKKDKDKDSQQERFPPKNSKKYTNIVHILELEYDIKRQIYSILRHIQDLKPNNDKKLLKQYLETLIQYFNRFSNDINSQPFSITGEFHNKDDTLESIISTLNSIIQQFDSIQTEQIRTELIKINKFLEIISPNFSNVDSAIVVVVDLGSHMYYKKDFNAYLQDFFKVLCNDLVHIHPNLSNNMEVINLNTQFQKPNFTFKNSNKELIREFINQL